MQILKQKMKIKKLLFIMYVKVEMKKRDFIMDWKMSNFKLLNILFQKVQI